MSDGGLKSPHLRFPLLLSFLPTFINDIYLYLSMAKKKAARRYYPRAKRTYRRAKTGMAGFKPAIDGGLAGIGAIVAQKYIGAWGAPAANGIIGWWRKNPTLMTLAGIQAGVNISGMLPFINGGGAAGGIGFVGQA